MIVLMDYMIMDKVTLLVRNVKNNVELVVIKMQQTATLVLMILEGVPQIVIVKQDITKVLITLMKSVLNVPINVLNVINQEDVLHVFNQV